MRTTIHNAIKARRAERGEEAEGGFSLIELIIVVVILGILVAVAIPLVGQLQKSATENAAKAAAANAATTAASTIANGGTVTGTPASPDASKYTLAYSTTPVTIDNLCVVPTMADGTALTGSGPGC